MSPSCSRRRSARADQGPGQGTTGFLRGQSLELHGPRGLGHCAEVHPSQGQGQGRGDDLDRLPLYADKGRPQDSAPHDLVEALLQCGPVQGPRKAIRARDGVDGTPGHKLVKKPQSLLRKGDGEDEDICRRIRHGTVAVCMEIRGKKMLASYHPSCGAWRITGTPTLAAFQHA